MAAKTHYLIPSNIKAMMSGVRMATLTGGVTTLHYVDGTTESARIARKYRFAEGMAKLPDFFEVVSAVQAAARGECCPACGRPDCCPAFREPPSPCPAEARACEAEHVHGCAAARQEGVA